MRYIVSNHYITIPLSISEVSLENLFPVMYSENILMLESVRRIIVDTQETISYRVRQLCREQGITPNKLSKISGVPQATIKSILPGESKNPGTVAIKRLCDGFGITLGEFFNTEEFDDLVDPKIPDKQK